MIHKEIGTIKQLANYLRCSEEFIKKAITNEFNVIDTKGLYESEYFFANDDKQEIAVNRLYLKKRGEGFGVQNCL